MWPKDLALQLNSCMTLVQFSSLPFSRLVVSDYFATLWMAAHQAFLSITSSRSLLRLMSIEAVMPSKSSHPLSSPSLLTSNLSLHQGLFT